MQKLGIPDLSLQVKAHKPTTTRSRKPPCARSTPLNSSPLPCPGPVRRSSRLQSVNPVSYSEALVTKNDKTLSSEVVLLREEGAKPEFYTEEHEKLLGSTEMEWALFVDGVGKDGKRIYDPVKGKTCHQCRQKTLGLRTHCSNCNMVQGQFCGDCLYMRYGENVIEANQNANWICPVCRGICNCSLCRQAKGWPPTGPLYRKITSLGYKSVAHFLIQTRRLKTETETDSNSKVQVSAKRSLAFEFIEEPSTEMLLTDFNVDPQVSRSPKHHEGENEGNLPCDNQDEKTNFSDGGDGDFKQEKKTTLSDKEQGDCKKEEEKTQFLDTEQGQLDTGLLKPDMNAELPLHLVSREKETDILVDKQHDHTNVPGEDNGFVGKAGLSGSFQIERAIEKINCEFNEKRQQDKTSSSIGKSKIDCTLAPESSPMSKDKRVRTIETTGDSIARRLRVRHNRENEEDHSPTRAGNGTLGTNKQDQSDTLPQCSADNPISSKSKRKPIRPSEPHPDDSIAGRLRQRRVLT